MGGAGLPASGALSAAGGGKRFVITVGRQVEKEFAEEECASASGDDKLRMAPDPTQSAPPGPEAFEYGCGVAEGPSFQSGSGVLFFQHVEQALQFGAHHVVVILSVGIPRELEPVRRNRGGRIIVQGHADYRLASFGQQARVEAFFFMPCHVVHSGMASLSGPLPEERGMCGRYGPSRCESASIKAEAFGPGFYLCSGKYVFGFCHLTFVYSITLNSYPCSLSHCNASGKAVLSFSMLLTESWNVMMEPLRV